MKFIPNHFDIQTLKPLVEINELENQLYNLTEKLKESEKTKKNYKEIRSGNYARNRNNRNKGYNHGLFGFLKFRCDLSGNPLCESKAFSCPFCMKDIGQIPEGKFLVVQLVETIKGKGKSSRIRSKNHLPMSLSIFLVKADYNPKITFT